jgi:hypothetical protein
VNQNKASQHVSEASRVLVAVRDAGVRYSRRMQPEEVNILCNHDSS